MKKFEGLLDEKLDLAEQFKRGKAELDELEHKVKDGNDQIKVLKGKIDKQNQAAEQLSIEVEEERKISKIEKDEKYRKFAQLNAALKAKLEFITSKYDFTTNVKGLNTDDFKQLMTSNDYVNPLFVLICIG